MPKHVREHSCVIDLHNDGLLIGYGRVSTDDQNLANQREVLTAAGCSRIFEEKVRGAKRGRPQLERLLDHLRPNDILVVTRLARLARSTRDLLEIGDRLRHVRAGLRSLAEPWADTTSPAGKMVLTIFAGVAEFERALILDRTRAGRAAAKARGVRFGRKPVLSETHVALAKELIEQGRSVKEIADVLGVHRTALWRAVGQ